MYLYKKTRVRADYVTHKPLACQMVPFFILLFGIIQEKRYSLWSHLLAEVLIFMKGCSLTWNIDVLFFAGQKYDLSCKQTLLIASV